MDTQNNNVCIDMAGMTQFEGICSHGAQRPSAGSLSKVLCPGWFTYVPTMLSHPSMSFRSN